MNQMLQNPRCPVYDTKLHLIGPLKPGVRVPFRAPSMSQIDLFKTIRIREYYVQKNS